MLKSVERLMSGASSKQGNHKRIDDFETHVSHYTYHDNTICMIDWNQRTAWIDDCGWNTTSTNRACNDYVRYIQAHFPDMKVIDCRQ